jgi:hypothetical protein
MSLKAIEKHLDLMRPMETMRKKKTNLVTRSGNGMHLDLAIQNYSTMEIMMLRATEMRRDLNLR